MHRKTGTSTTLNRRYVRRPQLGTEALEASVQEAAQMEGAEMTETTEWSEDSLESELAASQLETAARPRRISVPISTPEDKTQLDDTETTSASTPTASAPTTKRRLIKIVDDKDREAELAAAQAEEQANIERAQAEEQARIEQEQEEMRMKLEQAQAEEQLRAEQERARAEYEREQRRAEQEREKAHAERTERTTKAEKQMERGNALAPMEPARMHPIQATAIGRMQERKSAPKRSKKASAKEIKDREIKKALAASSKAIDKDVAERERNKKRTKLHFGIARVMLAVSCAAAAVMAIAYFVGTNMPDISMRVAAMQTGINASYPGYVPRGYSVTDLSSERGRVVINFANDENGGAFSMTEEKSSWDSNALLANYVKPEFGDDYTIVREQGLTIYVANGGAAWVNGGVAYKLRIKSGTLTKKQIRSIAVSL